MQILKWKYKAFCCSDNETEWDLFLMFNYILLFILQTLNKYLDIFPSSFGFSIEL